MWADVSGCGQMQADVLWLRADVVWLRADVGRCGRMWEDVVRCRQMKADTGGC
jgi:hypothetical protein